MAPTELGFAGPHSIPLPPHNSYEIIASSSTVTPRASRSPPFRAASSPPGINLSQATTPRPNPKQALLAGQAHSPPRAQAGMPPSMISGQSADADGPNDLQSTEAVGTPARIRPQQALQGSLASARRTRSSTGNAKPLGSAPSPGRPHHQDPVRPHHQDPVRPNLQDSDATPMESTTRPSAKPRQTSSYFPSSMPKSPVPGHGSAGLSEAGAYAKSIATALAMGQSDSPVRRTSASAPPVPVTDRRVSRPLPEPPALVKVSADPSQTSPPPVARSTVHAIASSRTTGGRNSAQSAELPFEPGDSRNRSPDRYNRPSIPKISSEKKQEQSDAPNIDQEQVNFERMIRPGDRRMPSSRPGNNDNSRSPSALGTTALPSLGPRLQLDTINPVEQGVTNAKSRRAIETSSKPFVANSSAATPVTRNPPPRVSSASSHNQHPASSSLSSAALPSSGRLVTHLKDIDPNKKPLGGSQQAQDLAALSPKASYAPSAPRAIASLPLLLANQQIQECLLPFLSINSFLSLTGASKVVRKLFTGETVGRWVTREWDLQLDRERGRTWPNLTVWEGFRKSKFS